MDLQKKLYVNRNVEEFNGMTPLDALAEIHSWDFAEAFGDDAERLSDAIKRIEMLVYEVSLDVNPKNGLVVINKKFQILADVKFLDEGNEEFKEIHFYDSSGKEFYANLGDYPGCQDDMEEEIRIIENIRKGSDLYRFIKDYGSGDGTVYKFGENLYISAD